MRQLKLLPQTTAMAFQVVLVLFSMFLLDFTHSSESASAFSSANKVTAPEALSSISSSSSSSSNRHKRRVANEAEFYGDDADTEQALELSKSAHWIQPFEKRAPGWGKRAVFQQDDKGITESGWDKRAPGWGKRAPGWGKRALIQQDPGWGKRAPGWGKRAPGWGKRAPGWGKRASSQADPGWGKRATDQNEMGKDEAGWEKRAPGWGKRAPGWGKRSDGLGQFCQGLDNIVESLVLKAQEVDSLRQERCGSQETAKAPSRK